MTNTVLIQLMEQKHLMEVHRLHMASLAPEDEGKNLSVEEYANFSDRHHLQGMVATSNDMMLGYLTFGITKEDDVLISDVCVDPCHRREGVGTALLWPLIHPWDYDLDVKMIVCNTSDTNLAGHMLLHANGFVGELTKMKDRHGNGVYHFSREPAQKEASDAAC